MAPLNFDTRGYLFEQGLDRIIEAFVISYSAVQGGAERYEEGLLDYRSGSAVPPVPDEIDIEPEEFYAHILDNFDESISHVCEAFLMAAYHHWEKQTARWMNDPKANLSQKYKWLRDNGAQVDEAGLEDIREVLRYIKHDQGANAKARRPELFHFGPPRRSNFRHREDRLWLTPEIVESFFETIRMSALSSHPGMRIP